MAGHTSKGMTLLDGHLYCSSKQLTIMGTKLTNINYCIDDRHCLLLMDDIYHYMGIAY